MAKKFHNQILTKKATSKLLKTLAAGYNGEIKAVVDLENKTIAAGAEWHIECRDLLLKEGGDPDDMWGSRVNIETKKIVFKSQINDGREGALGSEIVNDKIRAGVEELIRKYLV